MKSAQFLLKLLLIYFPSFNRYYLHCSSRFNFMPQHKTKHFFPLLHWQYINVIHTWNSLKTQHVFHMKFCVLNSPGKLLQKLPLTIKCPERTFSIINLSKILMQNFYFILLFKKPTLYSYINHNSVLLGWLIQNLAVLLLSDSNRQNNITWVLLLLLVTSYVENWSADFTDYFNKHSEVWPGAKLQTLMPPVSSPAALDSPSSCCVCFFTWD